MVTRKCDFEKQEHRLSLHIQDTFRLGNGCLNLAKPLPRFDRPCDTAPPNQRSAMFRIAIACLLLLAVSDGAMAESPAERGNYLVNTIMACGNCHTPRDADGRAIADRAFSG